MRDLSTALRDHVDALAPPVRYDEVVTRRPQRNRPPFLLVAAALVVVIGLVAVLLQSDDEGSQVATRTLGSSADALRDEGTGVEIAWFDERGLVIGDPETGVQRAIGGPELHCCVLHLGQSIYAGTGEGVYRHDPPDYVGTRLADGNIVFPAATPDELYVASVRDGFPEGTDIRRITTGGRSLGGPWAVPEGFTLTNPPRVTARGILLASHPDLVIWDPATGATAPLGFGSRIIDTFVRDGATVLARTGTHCEEPPCPLSLTELASDRTRRIKPPGDDLEFLGGGGFSPDGTKLAAFSVTPGDDRRMRLVIVDVATGKAEPVARSTARFGEEYGFAIWSPDGRWVFFGGLQDRLLAHRVGTGDAAELSLPANYSSVAVRSSEPPASEDLEDRQFGFLKAIDEKERTLTFDLAEFFSGDAARRAADQDGQEAGDYYIRNRNPRLRELKYSESVRVHGDDPGCTPTSSEVCSYLAYDLPGLIRRLRDPSAPFYGGEEGVRVWLTIRDGVVVDIENPYFP